MLGHYLSTALRALARSPLYALINVVGLAIGLAACLALFLYVRFERSYDGWIPDADRTFQIQTRWVGDGITPGFGQESPYRIVWDMQRDFPQIETVASAFLRSPVVNVGGESHIVEDAWVADPTLFDVLRLPFAQGDRATALAEGGSAVLSEAEAARLFGERPAMGATFTVSLVGQDIPVRVTGILRDLPENTHLKMPMVIRLDRSVYAEQAFLFELWTSGTGVSYARLRPGASAEAINAALPAFERRRMPANAVGSDGVQPHESVAFSLANVRDVHLGPAQQMAQRPGNDPQRIATFSVVALLLLGISCVNFVNLATARSSLRAREVALRKVVGARRRQLIVQFIGESLVVTAAGMLLALALLELATPFLRTYLASALDFHYLGAGGLLPWIALLTLIVGVASGIYPAFVLSRFSPAAILNGGGRGLDQGGRGRLRNSLVIGQFTVSIALICCTLTVYAQTRHAMNRDPGFEKAGLVAITSFYRSQVGESARAALLDRLRALSGVTAVVRSNVVPPLENMSKRNFQRPGRAPQLIGDYYVEPGYFAAIGAPLLAGREFSPDVARDLVPDLPYEASTPEEAAAQRDFLRRGLNIVVNAAAARALGWTDPAAAVGQTIRADLIATEAGLVPATIVGIVPDLQLRSARDEIEPSIYIQDPRNFDSLLVRFAGVPPSQLLARMDAEWRRLVSEVPLQSRFVDDSIADLYARDILEGQMFAFFAALTTLVGCLGLFGLAAFAAERRTREIGIRKVLGARTGDIVRLLAWQFARPVIVANLVAWPIAWWAMRDWLNGFADRVDLSPLWFAAAGLLALAVALATTVGHTLRVARANPIHALRHE
jgi:putative ABC transport system permease protein